jgi:hypothetical protein
LAPPEEEKRRDSEGSASRRLGLLMSQTPPSVLYRHCRRAEGRLKKARTLLPTLIVPGLPLASISISPAPEAAAAAPMPSPSVAAVGFKAICSAAADEGASRVREMVEGRAVRPNSERPVAMGTEELVSMTCVCVGAFGCVCACVCVYA